MTVAVRWLSAGKTLEQALRNRYLRHSLVVLLASMTVNAGNYAFHFVASRHVKPADYGELYALISVLSVFGVVTQSVTTVLVRLTAELNAVDDRDAVAALHGIARRVSCLAGIALVLLAANMRVQLAAFLKIGDPNVIVPWAIILGGSIAIPPIRSIAQGIQDFRVFSESTIVEGISKAVLGSVAIIAGFGITGALAGQALAVGGALIFTEYSVRRRIAVQVRRRLRLDTKRFIQASVGIVAASLGITVLTAADAILAKHFLSAHDAGIYSAVSLTGKVLLFAVGFVPLIILPKATDAAVRKAPVLPFVLVGVVCTGCFAAVCVLLYKFAPFQILHVMVGGHYEEAARYLVWYGLAMTFLALTNAVVSYKTAIHSFRFVVPVLAVASLEIVAIVFRHSGLLQILQIVVVAQFAALLVCAVPWSRRPAIGRNSA